MVDLIYDNAKERLYDKMSLELQTLRSSMLKMTPSEIISGFHPYELIYKEDFLMCFEEDELDLTYDNINFLLKMDTPLDWIYKSWCDSSVSHMNLLQNFIKDTIQTQEVL